MNQFDEWPTIVSLIRSYSARKYGSPPNGLTIHLCCGEEHREPIPPRAEPAQPPPPASSLSSWASGDEPKHLSDFQRVYWPNLGVFTLTPKQRVVVRMLWLAMEAGNPEVEQLSLLNAADSDCPRLRDLFSRSPAWGQLVVCGMTPATYRLPPPPEDDPDNAA